MITKVYINELQGYCLENDAISLTVLLQGAKVASLIDKRKGKEWLWSQPGRLPRKYVNESFDCQWWGGMDDLFPNDVPSSEAGALYSFDHGVMWQPDWKIAQIEENKLILELQVEGGGICIRKSVLLEKEGLIFSYKIQNNSIIEIKGLFRLHPAFAMEPSVQLLVPGKKVICDRTYHSPICDKSGYNWPHMMVSGQIVDLSDFSNYASIVEILQYIELQQGFYELIDRETSSRIHFNFDEKTFPVLTLYAYNNSASGMKVVVLEPSTGPYANLDQVRSAKNLLCILPDEIFEFDVAVNIS